MRRAFLLALLVAGLAGCDHPQQTIDELRTEIAAYKSAPSDAAQAKIDADFAKLDAQINQLDSSGKASKAATFRASEENLRSDYRAARMVGAVKNAKDAIQGLGNAFKEAGQSIGDAFRDSAKPTPTPN
ncbi:MAG TPA: hypothetical protein VNB29_09985 [Chthoniobacterales bacterium]|nr:hypothetical protein [Chthoniobacterales bacterium]